MSTTPETTIPTSTTPPEAAVGGSRAADGGPGSEPEIDPGAGFRGIRVELAAFEGPLDLLLHLIQRDELDITDIPISHITEQFLSHLDLMKELDLEVAGEYLVMAATLVRIKSQLLLPRPPVNEEGEEIDPREELVQRLIEYRKFKMVAENLRDHESDRMLRHARAVRPPELAPDEVPIGGVTVFDLVSYLKKVLERVDENAITAHDVELETVVLEDRIERLITLLDRRREISFTDYLADVRSRMGVVVSFMAILELMKLGEVTARQDRTFTEIYIHRRDRRGVE